MDTNKAKNQELFVSIRAIRGQKKQNLL